MFARLWKRNSIRKKAATAPSTAVRARPKVEELESRVVPYGTTGNLWPHPELITISFLPDGTDLGGATSNLVSTFNARFGSAAKWQNEFLEAAQVWAQQTDINFAVVSDDGSPSGSGEYMQGAPNVGDIRIGGFVFGNSVLAVADFSPSANNYSVGGDITFNTGQAWNIGSTYDVFSVALHEIGHALGLDHSNTSGAVMDDQYSGVKTALNGDDIAGIRSIYSDGAARAKDAIDAAADNGTFAKAKSIAISSKTALVTDLDITTTSDVDFFKFTAPSGSGGTMKVRVQSAGLSLLSPKVWVYDNNQELIGSASGLNQHGAILNVTLNNIQNGKTYYVKVDGADSTVFGTGKYALAVAFGSAALPAITPCDTQTCNGTPLHAEGGMAQNPSDGGLIGDLLGGVVGVVDSLLGSLVGTLIGLPTTGTGIGSGYGDAYSAADSFAGEPASSSPRSVERDPWDREAKQDRWHSWTDALDAVFAGRHRNHGR